MKKVDETTDLISIECKENNRNKSYLIGSLYQPSSEEKKESDMDKKTEHYTLHNHQHLE